MANNDLNSATGADSILDKVWNYGTGLFDRGLNYFLEKEQAERMIKLREAEAAADLAKKENYTVLQSAISGYNTASGANMVPYLAAGLIGLTAFVFAKRK